MCSLRADETLPVRVDVALSVTYLADDLAELGYILRVATGRAA
jgi:hypothetical protein